MAWSNKQKQIAVRACRQAGVDDAARKLILRQFSNAMTSTGPSSTAAKLDNTDFERFMAVIEDRAGGKVLHFSTHYFQDKAASRSTSASERQAAKIDQLYHLFEQQAAGGLKGHGTYGFGGLVRRVSAQRTDCVAELTPREASDLIGMLQAMIGRRGPRVDQPARRQQRLFADSESQPSPRVTTVMDEPPAGRRRRHRAMPEDEIPF